MVKFYETVMGRNVIEHQVPKIAKALESIAKSGEISTRTEQSKLDDILKRLEVLEFMVDLPMGEITCADGFQCLITHDIENSHGYSMLFPSEEEPMLDNCKYKRNAQDLTVFYTGLTKKLVAEVIQRHGGLEDA